jgi:hypothetical protein
VESWIRNTSNSDNRSWLNVNNNYFWSKSLRTRKYDGSNFVTSTYGRVDIDRGSTTIDHGGEINDPVKTEGILADAYVRHGDQLETRPLLIYRRVSDITCNFSFVTYTSC